MKIELIKRIWSYGFITIGKRWKRLFNHLLVLVGRENLIPRSDWWDWPIDLIFYSVDALLLSEMSSTLLVLVYQNVRFPDLEEELLINEIFRDSIDTRFVIINSDMSKFVQRFAYALVTYNIIHFKDQVEDHIFVHELMHIHQFQRFGSVYLYRAIKAQTSAYNYDYGGIERLVRGLKKGKSIYEYNFEQQAMIIEDFYRRNNDFIFFMKYPADGGAYEKYYNDLFS